VAYVVEGAGEGLDFGEGNERKAFEDYAEFGGFECEILLLPDFGTAKKPRISSLSG
jgi:hypothetical protein